MSVHGSAVAWWRVLPADGSPPRCDPSGALAHWHAEGTPVRPGGGRVDLAAAVVDPVAPGWLHEARPTSAGSTAGAVTGQVGPA